MSLSVYLYIVFSCTLSLSLCLPLSPLEIIIAGLLSVCPRGEEETPRTIYAVSQPAEQSADIPPLMLPTN